MLTLSRKLAIARYSSPFIAQNLDFVSTFVNHWLNGKKRGGRVQRINGFGAADLEDGGLSRAGTPNSFSLSELSNNSMG